MHYEENGSRQNRVVILLRQNRVVILSYNRANYVNIETVTSVFRAFPHVKILQFRDIDMIWIKAHFTTEDRRFAYISLTRTGHEK